MRVHSLGQLAEEMETHCSILAWKIPGTEEVHGLQSMKLQSQTPLSAHTQTHTHTHTHTPLLGSFNDPFAFIF